MVFALVRNPFSRLVSVFENKIRLGEPGYRRLEARYGDPDRFGGLQQAFAAFVQEVVTDAAAVAADAHLLPQTELIMPGLIAYTHIFRLEDTPAAIAALRSHLADVDGSPVPDPGIRNRSLSRGWRTYYDLTVARIVADVYSTDFSAFGYDPDDWHPGIETPQTAVASHEALWRSEVVARNAMIDELYDRLSVPRASTYADSHCPAPSGQPTAIDC
jgi:hypothetical protein